MLLGTTATRALLALALGATNGPLILEIAPPSRSDRPAVVDVAFRNTTPRMLSIQGTAAVTLDGTPGRFWAPFDLDRQVPAIANRATTLTIGPGETKQVTIDLRRLLWEERHLSVWPSRAFGEKVVQGTYRLRVEVTADGRFASAPVQRVFTATDGAAFAR